MEREDVRVLGVDRDAAPAARGAERQERQNPTVIELLDPLDLHLQPPLPGLLVPLLDPGAQPIAADNVWDARHSDPRVELVVGVNELRQEAINLAPIEDLVPFSR